MDNIKAPNSALADEATAPDIGAGKKRKSLDNSVACQRG